MGFGRTYPIWNKVEACIYKSSKDWGAHKDCSVEVRVGTSAKNSHSFLIHRTTRREHDDGRAEFRFLVDNVLIKQAILRDSVLELHSRFDYIDTKPTVPACPNCGFGGYYDETSKEIAEFHEEVRRKNEIQSK